MVLHGLGVHLGDVLSLLVISPAGMSPSKQVLGMHPILLIQCVFSILGFCEDATSSPVPRSAPS